MPVRTTTMRLRPTWFIRSSKEIILKKHKNTNQMRATTKFPLPFSIQEATNLMSMALSGCFNWIEIFVLFAFVLVYLSQSKSWRERGTKQVKIPILLLPETGFCCFQKLKRFLQTDNWTWYTGFPVNVQLQRVPIGINWNIFPN